MHTTGFVEGYLAETSGITSPEVFRLWAAIWAIGSAGRRRVWTTILPKRPIYPNLFIWLVGPPGTGKTEAIVPVTEILRKTDTVRLAPNDITKQGLLDRLAAAADSVSFPAAAERPPVIMDYHYMAISVRELSNFMSEYDKALAGILTDIFDNPPVNDEHKRSGAGAAIIKPSLSLLAGTATKNLGKTIGADLWGQGFMARVIMVYSADVPTMSFFGVEDESAHEDRAISPELVAQLLAIGMMKGRIGWTKGAQGAFNDWYHARDMEPRPKHAKLFEYSMRRHLHIAKLATISAMSDLRPVIETEDFERALKWLQDAERAMPEIFREMAVHSDGEVAREMHMHAFALWAQSKRPVHYSTLASFLMTKVPTRDIKRIIENAEEAGMFNRIAGTQGTTAQYKPAIDGQTKDMPE